MREGGHLSDERLLRFLDGEARGAGAHVEACSQCRARLERMRGVSIAIEDYSASLTDAQPADGRRQALLAALDAAGPRPIAKSPSGNNQFNRPLPLPNGHGSDSASEPRPSGSGCHSYFLTGAKPAPQPRRTVAAVLLACAAAVLLAIGIWRAIPRPAAPATPPGSAALGNGFIALPYSDENLSQEGAVVLEVEVPRSALLLAGMPAGDGQSKGRVKAEVMVGADGLARAIRFVN